MAPRAAGAALAILAISLVAGGCVPHSTLSTARTLDRGRLGLVASLAAGGPYADVWAFPRPELSARYGVTDTFELGGRLWLTGFAVESQVALLRSAPGTTGLGDISVAPGVGVGAVNAHGALENGLIEMPLLLGFNDARGGQLIVAPKLAERLYFARPGHSLSLMAMYAGGSVGYALAIKPGVKLIPEISVLVDVFDWGPGAAPFSPRIVTYQAGAAFAFGR